MSKARPRSEVSRKGTEMYKEPSLKTGYSKYMINEKPWDFHFIREKGGIHFDQWIKEGEKVKCNRS